MDRIEPAVVGHLIENAIPVYCIYSTVEILNIYCIYSNVEILNI